MLHSGLGSNDRDMLESGMSDWRLKFVPKSILFSNTISEARNTDLVNWGISIPPDPEVASSGAYTGPRRANARQFGNRIFLGGIIS